MNSVNPLYLIINKVNGYFEEIIENKHLTLVSTNESRKITKKKLLIMSKNLRNIDILNIKGSDYHCIIRVMWQKWHQKLSFKLSIDLTKKSGTL